MPREHHAVHAVDPWPIAESLRRVLREAGKLDDVRRQIGMPSSD